MLTRGEFHAVTAEDLKQLRRTKDGPQRRDLIEMDWGERWPEKWRCSTDKAWKFLHVVFAHQPGPSGGRAHYGLGLGGDMFYGQSLHRANFYVIGLVPNEWLPDILRYLNSLDEQHYRELYFSTDVQRAFAHRRFQEDHGIDTTETRWCDYTWGWLQTMRELFSRSADAGRSLVFSAENC